MRSSLTLSGTNLIVAVYWAVPCTVALPHVFVSAVPLLLSTGLSSAGGLFFRFPPENARNGATRLGHVASDDEPPDDPDERKPGRPWRDGYVEGVRQG